MTHKVSFASKVAASVLLAAGVVSSAAAQAIPPVVQNSTGFNLPRFGGQVTYAITASQLLQFGYNGGNQNVYSTNIGGNVGYLSNSERHPFSLIYSGGFLGSESSNLQPNTTYQDLAISQVLRNRHNTFIAADTVSYLPQSPVSGLSGIPGVGDLGISPVQVGGIATPGILTNEATRVTNIVSVTDSQDITGRTSIQGTGAFALERFLGNITPAGNNFFDNNSETASVGLNHKFTKKDTLGVSYVWERFTYLGSTYTFNANGVNLEYIHNFSPRMVLDASVGPQWNGSPLFTTTSLNLAVAANLTYTAERSSMSVGYSRGTNNGSGIVQGALVDSVSVVGRHNFTRDLTGAVSASYSHSRSLDNLIFTPFNINSLIVGAQASRGIGRSLSVYGSYTLERQTSANYLANTIAFNGLEHIVGFGITYSPKSRHFGR
jgi:hypothetical protein